ncbi:hypothetical protein GCM10009682_35050 [Luedemannella flava]|uniref:Uncharacterized protein n=1 Tax=Luedemannella flava TaxID=349316 RepID=A0ABP4YDQ7_9ACTN
MPDPEPFLRLDHEHRDGLHTYVAAVSGADVPSPAWPGLWEQDYPTDPELSPFFRFGVNNVGGEALAVWRALAWALTEGRQRRATPSYYREKAALLLGVDRAAVPLVLWEYKVDAERDTWADADIGFVPARSCVRLQPPPDPWEREHADFAGLFALTEFRQLTALDVAVSFDLSSEVTLFGVADPQRLQTALAGVMRPCLAELLHPGDLVVDLSIVRDIEAGGMSFLSVRSPEPLAAVATLADHYSDAFRRYRDRVADLKTFDDFAAAMTELLAPPDGAWTP